MKSIEKLHLKIAKCQVCDSITGYRKFPFGAHGNVRSKVMIISEAPGKESIEQARFWLGRSGKLLRECLQHAGKNLERDFYVTDVVKCWPNSNNYKNRKPDDNEIMNCRKFITKEVEILQPTAIFLFGKISAELFFDPRVNMGDLNGKRIETEDGKILYCFYHPSYILRQNDLEWETEYREQLIKAFLKEA